MKKIVAILGAALCISGSVLAQEAGKEPAKGAFLGSDNDQKEYLIGAPADNWFINFGGGVQTFIGNEYEKSACLNPVTPAAYLEIGKWLIPGVAISLQVSGFNSVGQTRYSLNPYADFSEPNPTGTYSYKQIKFFNMAVNGMVTFDWTNIFNGYEKGGRRKVHILTPIGLGFAYVNGENVNTNPKAAGNKDNFELDFVAAIIPEITLSENIRLVPAIRFQMERGSVDFSGRDLDSAPEAQQSKCRFDFQPAFTLGLKFNLSGTKKGATHKTKYRGEVPTMHVFQAAPTAQLVEVVKTIPAEVVPAPVVAAVEDHAQAVNAGQSALNPLEEVLAGVTGISEFVFFPLGESTLDLNAETRLKLYADTIKESDDKAKFFIIGAADKVTGSEKLNYELSVSRCKAIYNKLVKNYGVYPGKLEIRALGGVEEYKEMNLNRLGIITQSSDALSTVLDKYSKKY